MPEDSELRMWGDIVICRICGGAVTTLFNLGNQPLANSLLISPQDRYESYPLEVVICKECHLGQLRKLVPPEKMFLEYVYYTSVSGASVESASTLVRKVIGDWRGTKTRSVVEIGSNDGYLLQFYKSRGVHVLGIDPARGPANAAALLGIPTIQEFFTFNLARKLPQANVIHANNVLAHVPSLDDFVAGLSVLLKTEGTCFIEVPYLGSLLEKCEFDTIYHEHSYYFSFRALETLFRQHGLFITDVERLGVHGGSLRLTVKKVSNGFMLPENLPAVKTIKNRAEEISLNLREALLKLRGRGKKVWGFGAAAKATVMMNYCRISDELILAVADDAPAKLGKYIPGTGVQIRHPAEWLKEQPDYTCIFSWNYADELKSKYTKLYQGEFFTPYILPENLL